MARIFLDRNENFPVPTAGNTILGQAGGDPGEAILVDDGVAGLRTNAGIERLDLPLGLAAHTFQVTADGLEISANGEPIVTIPSLNQTLELRTADGGIEITQTGARRFTAANPTDPSDTDTIGTTPVTPDIGADAGLISATATARKTLDVGDNGPVDEGGTAIFTLGLDEAADQPVSVDYAVGRVGGASAADHGRVTVGGTTSDALTGTLALAAGETSRTIEIPITDDAVSPEDGEGINVTLSNLQGPEGVSLGTSSTTAGIADAALSFTLARVSERVWEGQRATYDVTASAPVAADTTVAFEVVAGDPNAPDQGTSSTNLNDFQQGAFNPSTTTIPAGETSTRFTVGTLSDEFTELPEDFAVEAVLDGQAQRVTTTLLDGGGVGQRVFALTSGADTFQPNAANDENRSTSGPDIFRGTDDGDVTGADVIKAADGDDTVKAVLAPDGTDDDIAPSLDSVETVVLDAADGDDGGADTVVFDGANSTDVETIRFDNPGDGNAVGAQTDTVKAEGIGTDVEVAVKHATNTGGGSAAVVDFDGAGGDGDAATLAFDDADIGNGTANDGVGLTVDNIEALTLNADGASGSTIDDLDAGAATSLSIGGTRPLTIRNALAGNAANIDTVTVTGAAAVTTGALGDSLGFDAGDGDDGIDATGLTGSGNRLTATTGAGDDTIKLGGNRDTVDAGPGDDAIFLNNNLTKRDEVDGGAGIDVILDTSANLAALANNANDEVSALSSTEGIGVTDRLDRDIDVSAFGAAGERVEIRDKLSSTSVLSGLGASTTLQYEADKNTSKRIILDVQGATDVGSPNDSITFVANEETDVQATRVVKLGLPGLNTLNVESRDLNTDNGGGVWLNLNNTGTLETINVRGPANSVFDVTQQAGRYRGLETIDASATTGDVTVNLSGSKFRGSEGVAVTSANGDDTITGTQFVDAIATGRGADVVVYDGESFGATDRITDFSSGDDTVVIDVAAYSAGTVTAVGGIATVSTNRVATDTAGTTGALSMIDGGLTANASSIQALTTGAGRATIGIGTSAGNDTVGTRASLTSGNQVFSAASLSALQSAVTSAAAQLASDQAGAGALAFGVTSGQSRLVLFRITDTDGANTGGAGELTTVTNTVATIGSGTIAAADIAVF